MIRASLALFISFCLVANNLAFAAAAAGAPQAADPASYEESMAEVDANFRFFEALRGEIDRSQFDLEALLDSLDYDAERIIEYVQRNIFFEQYTGTLRGAQGTLMSRAGNALDQALLLATLLRNAGYDARITRGQLDAAGATELLSLMAQPRPPRPYPIRQKDLAPIFLSLARQLGVEEEVRKGLQTDDADAPAAPEPLQANQLDVFAPANAEADALIKLLQNATTGLQPGTPQPALNEEARDYFWVQWKDGEAQPWTDIHPSGLDQLVPDLAPAVAATYADSIPDELQHRLRIEATIEQEFNGKIISHAIMAPWERPVSNMLGQQITFMNLPDQLTSQQGFDNMDQSIADSTFFIPLFQGAMAKGAMAFDMDGNVVSPDALQGGFAGLFRQLGRKTEKAAAALSQLGKEPTLEDDDDLVRLYAHRIHYTFIDPSGKERRITRTVLDREHSPAAVPPVSSERNAANETLMKKRLSEHQNMMVAAGEFPEAYVLDALLKNLVEARDAARLAAELSYYPQKDHDLKAAKGTNFFAGPQLQLYSYFDLGAEQTPGARAYRASPSLITVRQELEIGPNVLAMIDVVKNDRRAVALAGGQWQSAPELALRTGIWETWIERQTGPDSPNSKVLASAANLISRAQQADIPLQVIAPGQPGQLEQLQLPEISLAAMRADLDNGYHVIAPQQPLPDSSDWGVWYRVNTQTGETLGLAGNGMGATVAEYVVMLISISVGTIAYLRSQRDCMGTDRPTGAAARTDQAQAKSLACTLCSLWAGVTAALLVYTVGVTAVAGYGALAGSGLSVAARLQITASTMMRNRVPPEVATRAVAMLAGQMLCTEADIMDW